MHTAWSLTLVMYRCRFIFKLLNMHLHTRWSHSFLQMTHMWTLPNDKLFVYIQTRIKNFHQTKIFRLILRNEAFNITSSYNQCRRYRQKNWYWRQHRRSNRVQIRTRKSFNFSALSFPLDIGHNLWLIAS